MRLTPRRAIAPFVPYDWFTAASGGRLARLHYDQKASLTEPFDLGRPFPAPGDLARQRDEHARTHHRPDAGDWTDRIEIVPDENADFGFDMRPS